MGCTKRQLQRAHVQIYARQADYPHKMTTEITSRFQLIGLEDLNVAGMVQDRRLALPIPEADFGEIRRQLAYKADWFTRWR